MSTLYLSIKRGAILAKIPHIIVMRGIFDKHLTDCEVFILA